MINGLPPLSTLVRLKVNSNRTSGRCVNCLSRHASHGLCQACLDDLPANLWHCYQCALPLPYAAQFRCCGECQKQPPPFHRSLIPWRYQFPVDGMIGRYKYQGQRQYARPLLAGLASYLQTELAGDDYPDLILPAPMHWTRRWRRGFNQAQDIAEHLSEALAVPLSTTLLRRTRRARPQRGLDRTGRLSNLKGSYQVHGEVPARVAIVDDVVTTGATVRTIADTLARAGAEEIQVWALARTQG